MIAWKWQHLLKLRSPAIFDVEGPSGLKNGNEISAAWRPGAGREPDDQDDDDGARGPARGAADHGADAAVWRLWVQNPLCGAGGNGGGLRVVIKETTSPARAAWVSFACGASRTPASRWPYERIDNGTCDTTALQYRFDARDERSWHREPYKLLGARDSHVGNPERVRVDHSLPVRGQ